MNDKKLIGALRHVVNVTDRPLSDEDEEVLMKHIGNLECGNYTFIYQPPEGVCEHHRWDVRDYDQIGYGHCIDCNKTLPLSKLINNSINRMQTIIDEIESKL